MVAEHLTFYSLECGGSVAKIGECSRHLRQTKAHHGVAVSVQHVRKFIATVTTVQ